MDQSEHNPSDTPPPPPRSLTERLKAEANGHLPAADDLTAALMARVAGHSAEEPTPSLTARVAGPTGDEPTPSFMARRFAPDGVPLPDARRVEVKAPLAPFVAAQPPEARGMRTLIGALILVALVPSAMLGALFWFELTHAPSGQAPASRQGAAPTAIEQASVTATVAPATTRPKQDAELPAVALTVQPNLVAQAGQEVDFPIALDGTDGLPARSIVTISGLPAGAIFSDGRPYGQTEWSLRSDEIGDLTLALPANAAGSSKLGVQLLAADGRIIASAETLLQVGADPKAAGVVHRPEDTAPIADLMAHGNKMVDVGYFPGARAYFQRAAEAGSGEAALALGETYDPSFIARIGAQGIRPEPDQAVVWYERAREMGAAGAEAKLADLKVAAKAAAADADPLPAVLVVPDAAPASGQGAPNVVAPAEHTGDAGTTNGAAPTTSGVAATGGVPVPGGEPVELVELTGSVNVRESPSPNAATVTVMEIGTKLRAIGRKGGWVQVTDPATAQTGWVFSRYVTTLAAAGQ